MRRIKIRGVFSLQLLLLLISLSSRTTNAQTTTLTGIIIDAQTNAKLAGANVVATLQDFERGTSTSLKGEYKIENLHPGNYTITATYIGYEEKIITNVAIATGKIKVLNIVLIPTGIEMNQVVVTASRRFENIFKAPAAVKIIDSSEIESTPTLVPSEYLKGLSAVDIVSTGLNQDRVVFRGFNSAISARLLVFTDYRIAQVPSLRFNVYNLIPPISEDIESIELVLGPGSALYGPNSAGGIMHIITHSPFNSKGTSIIVGAGERSILMTSVRHAGTIGQQFGYKISGRYYRGEDWQYFDPAEPDSIVKGLQTSEGRIPQSDTIANVRDFDIEKISGEARLDFRIIKNLTAIISAGFSRISDIEITDAGAAQAIDWTSSYIQGRLSYGNLFAQVYYNLSDAGNTFFLRTGDILIDNSTMLVSQIQHGFSLMNGKQNFSYGADFLFTRPNTEYTLHGRNEDDDNIDEMGVYLQSETAISSKLKLILAARIDNHSILQDPVFSPRVAIIHSPTFSHNFRLTYNNAYQTPDAGDFFFDFDVSDPRFGPYRARFRGVPETGYNFRRDENGGIGGLYMQSPFTLVGQSQYLPAEATQMWDAVVFLLAQEGIDLSVLPPPTPEQVETIFRLLNVNTGELDPTVAEEVIDIAPLEPRRTTTIELGYKGVINDNLILNTNIYYEKNNMFVAPYAIVTPWVFFEPTSLTAYLSNFMASEDALALAAVIGSIAVGTVTPEEGDPADLLVTTRTYSDISHYGVELDLTFFTKRHWIISGNYTYVSKNFWERKLGEPDDVSLNAPINKIGLSVQYDNPKFGLNSKLRFRYIDNFPVISGIGRGSIPSYFLIDFNASYKVPFDQKLELALSIQNLLNNLHYEFVAVPEIGRLAILRIKYSF
ncbi:MAG: TonB-dependent receptor [Ignavibacterium sp.]|nr:MAG: TonB-dependent receptor [Ignavibacterium sp.]